MENILIRSTAVPAGEAAIDYVGDSANAISHRGCVFAGPYIGVRFSSDATLGTSFTDGCTFEGGSHAGILFADKHQQAIEIKNCYFEGIRAGVEATNGDVLGIDISDNIFSSCEFSIKASTNSFRAGRFMSNSVPDEGEGIRNLIDVSAVGNDLLIQLPGLRRTAPGSHLTNIRTNPACTVIAPDAWTKLDNTVLAKTQSYGAANNGTVTELPYNGRAMVTTANQPPFLTYSNPTNSRVTVVTEIIYDQSQVLVFNINITDFDASRNLHGQILGSTVYRLDQGEEIISIESPMQGKPVVLHIDGVNTTGGSLVFRGMVRHM